LSCLVRLDPTLGSEVQKTRPCVIVSPDELNAHLRTVIVAPMTTAGRAYPWRIRCRFQRRSGYVVLDQLRTVDRERLVMRLGALSAAPMSEVLAGLQEMFAA
jgi:mRNA interferase MazF